MSASISLGCLKYTIEYSTNFLLTESQISETGNWHYDGGSLWTPIATSGGLAYGTQAVGIVRDPDNYYNDSFAHLTGYGNDHSCSATIYRTTSLDTTSSHEFELLLRWQVDPVTGYARGYECNMGEGYSEIVVIQGVLNGPSNFAYLSNGGSSGGHSTTHVTGDVFSAQIIGDTITTYLNGTIIQTVTDTSTGGHAQWSNGNPGIGLFRGHLGGGTLGDIGFTSFSAVSL